MEILKENQILVVYIPATNRAFVWRVVSLNNRDLITIDYGPLPITANYPLSSYVAGSILAPASGVMPGLSYIPVGSELTFPLSGAYDETDMWYLPEDYRERVFHVIAEVTPRWLRCEVTVPKGVTQGRFQRDKVTTGIEKTFGYKRGSIEVVHIPRLRYGYRFGNDSNLNVYTGVRFKYGEYVIETPKDAEFIFNVLTRRIKADRWISLPVQVYDDSVKRALMKDYGIEGFPLYGVYDKAKAISEYNSLLREVLV